MRYYSDSHIHSTYTQHPSVYYSTMEEQAKKAVELGLMSITITEHLDVDDLIGPKFGYIPHLPMDAYYNEYLATLKRYCHQLDIRFGIEIGLMDEAMEETVDILKDWDFDFKIASVHHFKNSFDYSDRFLWEQHPERSKRDAMLAYIDAIVKYGEMLGDFDVIGHLTYLSRMCSEEDPEIRYEHAP
ncbi:PHP domain-containing protein, partial [Eubacteriales bacterium OttesenSCG-928-M02]|nr:PHP domain-containing protein [Eubacteriales bacterium OttesenSCG-928-M02]